MVIQSSQWIVIPGLLIWSLHRFAVDANNTDWVTRTVWGLGGRKQHSTWGEYFFGDGGVLEDLTIGAWDSTLRWIVNRGRSDTWVLILLIFSASVIASAVYFLWRVALFPQVNNIDAIMIGVTVTTAFFLCAIVPEAAAAAAAAEQASSQADFPPLPPIIMASYSTIMHMLGSLPSAVFSSLSFLHAAFQTIAPSVMISLTYRIIVFYCATRIIPAVRESGARALMDEPSLDDSDGANRLLGFLSWFSPSILIAVYTSLLLQHFSTNGDEGWTLKDGDAGGNVWRWVNVSTTMALYAIELYLGHDDDDGGVVSHWKTD
ncbi:hypothetical protein PG987_003392 [Apiospora arundinis]